MRTDAFGGAPAVAKTDTTPAPDVTTGVTADTIEASPETEPTPEELSNLNSTGGPIDPPSPEPDSQEIPDLPEKPNGMDAPFGMDAPNGMDAPKKGRKPPAAQAPEGDNAKIPEPAAPEGDNAKIPEDSPRREEFFTHVKALGTAEGRGVQSMPDLAISIAQNVRDGIISVAKGSPDIDTVFETYMQARAAAEGVPYAALSSQMQQVSKLRKFGKAASPEWKFDGSKLLVQMREYIGKAKPGALRGRTTLDKLNIVADAIRNHVKQFGSDKAPTLNSLKGALAPREVDDTPPLPDENEAAILKRVEKMLLQILDGTDEIAPCESREVRTGLELLRKRAVAVAAEIAKREA